MALLLPALRSLIKRSQGVKDPATAEAIRNLEDYITELVRRLAELQA